MDQIQEFLCQGCETSGCYCARSSRTGGLGFCEAEEISCNYKNKQAFRLFILVLRYLLNIVHALFYQGKQF